MIVTNKEHKVTVRYCVLNPDFTIPTDLLGNNIFLSYGYDTQKIALEAILESGELKEYIIILKAVKYFNWD